MKKILFITTFILSFTNFSIAQVNIGASATYTNYGEYIGKPSPGIQVRGAYNFRNKLGAALGLSYNLPLKYENEYLKQTSNFASASLLAVFHIIGGYEDNFSLYIPAGATLVYGKSTFEITDPSFTAKEDEDLSGIGVTGGLGLQFSIGTPYIFAEAAFVLPSGTYSNTRTGVTTNGNPLPSHTILSLGLRYPLGGQSIGGSSSRGNSRRGTSWGGGKFF